MPILEFENLPSKRTPIPAEVLEELQTNLLKMVYPIGAPYYNADISIDPAKELGFGEWELAEGVVLVGASRTDEDFQLGKTGGKKEHLLTMNELPLNTYTDTSPSSSFDYRTGTQSNGNWLNPRGGGGLPHNNMQPYKVSSFMWIRTA